MGYWFYIQKCDQGHAWTAHFSSVDFSDSRVKECPTCKSTKITTEEAHA